MAKEREYQTILQQVLKEREQEITLLRMRSESAGLSLNSDSVQQEHSCCTTSSVLHF